MTEGVKRAAAPVAERSGARFDKRVADSGFAERHSALIGELMDCPADPGIPMGPEQLSLIHDSGTRAP